MKQPKTITREYGDCLLRIIHHPEGGTEYTLVSTKRTLLDFHIFDSGKRINLPRG